MSEKPPETVEPETVWPAPADEPVDEPSHDPIPEQDDNDDQADAEDST